MIETLRKFAALRGWPSVISSDPGSQLVSAAGKMECWWAHWKVHCKNWLVRKDFDGVSVQLIVLGGRVKPRGGLG